MSIDIQLLPWLTVVDVLQIVSLVNSNSMIIFTVPYPAQEGPVVVEAGDTELLIVSAIIIGVIFIYTYIHTCT